MILRKLEPGEHGKTRELWEKVFSDDTKAFLDYYYYIKTRDNEIWVIEEEGQICSMIQLNPYKIRVGAKEFPSAYIIAVATREPYRGRGFMGALLRKTLEEMQHKKMPFTFLMPAAEAIYTPYDFRFIYSQKTGTVDPSQQGFCSEQEADEPQQQNKTDLPAGLQAAELRANREPVRVTFSDAGLWDAQRLADFFLENFDGQYQVCTVRDTAYYQTMIMEQASERGGVRMIEEEGSLRGYYAYADEGGLEIREPLYLDGYEEEFLRSVSELAKGRADKIPAAACPPGYAEQEKPLIMARIVSLPEFLSALSVPEDQEMSCSFAVIDPILTKNSRVWKLESGIGESAVSVRETEDSEGVIPVAELTEYLFGRIGVSELGRREGVILSPHLEEELEKITKLTRTWFNEVV